MTPPDTDLVSFIKDWLWAPLLGLIAWAWNRNEQEHEMLRQSQSKLSDNTSTGYSTLNDRVMEHVDEKVHELRVDHGHRLDKAYGHIEKLFENAEKDRAAFREALATHATHSTERHIELMHAIHTGLSQKADK